MDAVVKECHLEYFESQLYKHLRWEVSPGDVRNYHKHSVNLLGQPCGRVLAYRKLFGAVLLLCTKSERSKVIGEKLSRQAEAEEGVSVMGGPSGSTGCNQAVSIQTSV